jgi:4-hydroxy-3-methylbut-2-en-1-yl diphosphate reductase
VSAGLLVLSPLRIEARAARRGAPSAEVVRTGMGERRSRSAAALAANRPARAVAVLGFCGSLDDSLEPGSVILADELRGGDAPLRCERLPQLEKELQEAGFSINRGPIVSVPKAARGAERARLAEDGSLAVDMETAWLAEAAAERPFAALRAVVDTPSRELVRFSTVSGALRAYRALGRAAGALETWFATLPDEKET